MPAVDTTPGSREGETRGTARAESGASAEALARAGRSISIVGHPLVVVPASIVVATTGAPPPVRARILAVVGAAMTALSVFVIVRARRGEFTDVDVSSRAQRPALYRVAILCTVSAALVFWWTDQPPLALRGAVVASGVFVAGSVINRWVKVSLHCAFGAMAAGVAWRAGVTPGIVFAVAALVVGWGRVTYRRHTPREVAVGLALGGVAAVAFAWSGPF